VNLSIIVSLENGSMKKLMFVVIILTPLAIAAPGYTFFDWLFSGGASRDAIDNSALGDLRAWWTGNPGYVFNPWWSGPSNPGAQGMSPGAPSYGPQAAYPQMPQPSVSYYPPQGSPAGYGQSMQQPYGQGMTAGVQQYPAAPQNYQPAPQYQMAPQAYQTAPQAYQTAPQYQQMPQTYQSAPQGYQAAPQMMQQPMAQTYPGMVGSPQTVPQGSYGR
jgi:hypothetical protein